MEHVKQTVVAGLIGIALAGCGQDSAIAVTGALPGAAVAQATSGAKAAASSQMELVSAGARSAGAAPGSPPAVRLSHSIPEDVAIPADFEEQRNPIMFFDDHSWRLFVALSWPAAPGRGVPDTAKKVGDAGATVWQTWKAGHEIFQPKGARPSDWDSFDGITPCPRDAAPPGTPQLAAFSKLELQDFNQASFFGDPAGPLIAQNRTYVRFETRVNRLEYEKILGTKDDPKSHLYLAKNLPAGSGADKIAFPDGSIEIKAAWREIKDGDGGRDRYHHMAAQLKDPVSGKCRTATMGLVGLHIVHKTKSRPQWIWSTFEHVDNLTPPASAGVAPTFNDPKGPQTGPTVNRAPDPIDAQHPPKADPDPVQCVREKTTNEIIPPESTQETNTLYREALRGTVWENYQLVMTQWPTKAFTDGVQTPGAGRPFPSGNVANITMETYEQGTSCMGCHVVADDVDFAWFLRVHAFQESAEERERTLKNVVAVIRHQTTL